MSFIRKIKKPSGTYLARVESYRKDGKVKQRVIEYLGKSVKGKPVKRILPTDIKIDAVKRYLDLWAVHQLSLQLGIPQMLGNKGKPLLALIYSHLLGRTSINKMEDWLSQTDIFEILKIKSISTKQLYASLDYINEFSFVEIERTLEKYFKTIEPEGKKVVIDVTDTYFNGSEATWKSRRGKDGKYDKLLQIGLSVSFQHGFPIFHKTYEGNINGVKILQDMLVELTIRGYEAIIVDRGMYSTENVERMEENNIKGIMGVKQSAKLRRDYIDKIEREKIFSKECMVKLKETSVYIKSFDYQNGQLIVIYNPVLEVHKRQMAMEKKKKINSEELKYLGYSLLFNNTDVTDKEAVQQYFDKDIIEKSFREIKGVLSLRPIRVWLLRHVEAHIKICYLAYAILSLLRYRVKPLNISACDALEALKPCYKVYFEDTRNKKCWSQQICLTKVQENIVKHLCCSV